MYSAVPLQSIDGDSYTIDVRFSAEVNAAPVGTALPSGGATGGLLVTPTIAVLNVEGERFGRPWLSLVRMVKTGEAWQFDQAAQAGSVR